MWSCRGSQGHSCGGRLPAWTHSERVADRVCQLSAIQGVEVKIAHAVSLQRVHLLDGDARSDETPRLGIVIEAVEAFLQPARNAGAAAAGHAQHLREARDRQDARHDRRAYAAAGAKIAKAQEGIRSEEH